MKANDDGNNSYKSVDLSSLTDDHVMFSFMGLMCDMTDMDIRNEMDAELLRLAPTSLESIVMIRRLLRDRGVSRTEVHSSLMGWFM